MAFFCLWGLVADLSLWLSCLVLDGTFEKQHTAWGAGRTRWERGEGGEEGRGGEEAGEGGHKPAWPAALNQSPPCATAGEATWSEPP